jgi:chromosome segregation ATPase
VADQTNKFDDLTRELAQTKQRLQTCEKDLTDSKTSLQQHLQQFAAERATNASRIAHLVSELEQLHREWALIQDSVARQKSAMSQLNEELNQAQTEIQKLRGSLDERDADLARHAEMLSGRNQQLMDLQSRLSDLQSESSAQLDQRNAIIVRLETALKMLREGHQELSIRLHARLEELGALASRLDVREHQLTEMSQESEKLTKRIAAAQEATRAKDDEIGRLRSQIASLEDASRIDSNEKASKISKLEANNKTLLSEKQALARSIEDRFREIAILTNMLQQRNSLWWHVTASLRSVRAPFLAAPRKLDKETKRNVSLIKGSGLFDEKWYLEKYPDVASDGWDPVEHYLKHGAAEGRCPGSHFDTRWYLKTYPDVQRERINPLVHFIKFGKHENRRPKP